MSEFKTHTCNEISLDDVVKKVRIAGFVETIRDLGGLVFLDIRDMYGITQVVTSKDSQDVDLVSHIPIESSVTVYLDLRSEKLQNNLKMRAQVLQYLRNQMTEQGFLEVQTPILTSSSPEGARDYLVPSRLHPGKFYALPQAPQQFIS